MITINLLPEEYRRKARTPLELMLAVSAVVAINSVLVAVWGWNRFGVEARLASERGVLELEMEGLEPQVAYHKALESEAQGHRLREETLAAVTASRISWTKELDQFIDVVAQGDATQRHLAWFSDFDVKQVDVDGRKQRRGASPNGGTLRASGYSGSENFGQVANFLDDLEKSPFLAVFHGPSDPEGSESVRDADLVPSVVWSFPLELEIKTVEQRQADREQREAQERGEAQ